MAPFYIMEERGTKAGSDRRIIALCALFSFAIFALDLAMPLGVAAGVPYVVVVLISLWSTKIKLPIYMAVGVSVLTVAGLFFSPPGGEFWQVMANRLLALFAIWATAVLVVQRALLQKEKEKAQFELNVLKGLLPICASCKKIRDVQGNWSQIESYISSHADVEFSHGYCPQCVEELYAEI